MRWFKGKQEKPKGFSAFYTFFVLAFLALLLPKAVFALPSASSTSAADSSSTSRSASQPRTSVSILPKPVTLNYTHQGNFTLAPQSRLVIQDEKARSSAEILAMELRESTGFSLPLVTDPPADHDIVFVAGDVADLNSDEEYQLDVDQHVAKITASSAHGFFNGTRSLKQAFPTEIFSPFLVKEDWSIPSLLIKDAPRFAYRGIMIDPARSFITVDEVKKIIDRMADLKLSALHVHLTDDQGYRIEITNDGKDPDDPIDYSKLTKVSGAMAINTHELAQSKELGRTGYYTQQEYRDIVAYGDKHFVSIIPEVDLPGHNNAALHAIPELNTPGSSHKGTPTEPVAPENPTGQVGYSYLDPDSDVTWKYIKHVLKQIADMTTSTYFHIGGDEPWAFHNRYGKDKYNSTVKRVLEMVRSIGKNPIGWSEISTANTQPSDVIQYWVHNENDIKARANEGTKVLMSFGPRGYLDQKYNPKTPIALTWACQNHCDAREYYNWDPANVSRLRLSDDKLAGVEGALWNETVRGGEQAEFLIWPRAGSYAEISWTPQASRNINDFLNRMGTQGVRWTLSNTNFYDTPQTGWDYDLIASKDLTAPPATNTSFPLGYIAAPGTKLADDTISIDTKDDADGTSSSRIPDEGLRVLVDWGDNSTETAHLIADRPRDSYGAPGLYRIVTDHNYANPGTYPVTISAGKYTKRLNIKVEAGLAKPTLPAAWDTSQTPTVTMEKDSFKPKDRIKTSISGFEPNKFVDIYIGDVLAGQYRPDENGNRTDQYLFIPAAVANGSQEIRFVQGDRVAKLPVTVTDGRTVLKNPVAHEDISLADFDSEEPAKGDPNGPAATAVDGNPKTFWHTQWRAAKPNFPHYLTIKLNEAKRFKVTGFEYTARESGENGRVKDFDILVSMDNKTWKKVFSGQFKNDVGPQAINFPEESWTNARYVKLLEKNSWPNNQFGGAAELRVGAIAEDPDRRSTALSKLQEQIDRMEEIKRNATVENQNLTADEAAALDTALAKAKQDLADADNQDVEEIENNVKAATQAGDSASDAVLGHLNAAADAADETRANADAPLQNEKVSEDKKQAVISARDALDEALNSETPNVKEIKEKTAALQAAIDAAQPDPDPEPAPEETQPKPEDPASPSPSNPETTSPADPNTPANPTPDSQPTETKPEDSDSSSSPAVHEKEPAATSNTSVEKKPSLPNSSSNSKSDLRASDKESMAKNHVQVPKTADSNFTSLATFGLAIAALGLIATAKIGQKEF